ncbi:MAG: hypothetical protein K2J70_00200, partial [Muribaculaceae bacterium]|nr:hypothetical protein [Muribaculaceae bacterium]
GSHEVTLYTAEREMPGVAGFPRWFNVTLERIDGTGQPIIGKVYLCDYGQGQPNFEKSFDKLIRNHDYRYEISLAEMSFVVSFKEWIYGGKVHIDLE